MIKVLYLTMNPNRQSTTVPTEGWLRLLPERGLEPVVVVRTSGAFSEWVAAQGIPLYRNALPFPSRRHALSFFKDVWSLRNIVKRHEIQIIHCNEQDVYPIGQYVARLTGIPVVLSVHFTMDRGYTSWAFAGRRRPARVFFVSRGNLEACRPAMAGIVDESRWRVLYNGLDLDHYRPDASRRAEFREAHGLDDRPLVGVACALRPRKQLEHLIDAAARIRGTDFAVAIAGGPVAGDEAYAEALMRDAERRLGARLLRLGHLDELRDLYNGLDVFVNTSQEEACSISVMEALACGCPVLGYASKSVDDQILPEGGEIVGQDDVAMLADRLESWLGDRHALAARRAGARRRAERMFDIRTLAGELWQEYESVLDA